MPLNVHMPEHRKIDLGEQNITCADSFYLPHTTPIKQDVVFQEKHIFKTGLIFSY